MFQLCRRIKSSGRCAVIAAEQAGWAQSSLMLGLKGMAENTESR